ASMEHIPYEIWNIIVSHLHLNGLKQMSRTSRLFRSICLDSILHQDPQLSCSWECPYIIQYLIKKRCGKLLTIDICTAILNDKGICERLVDFLSVVEGKQISQKTANYAFQFACQYGITEWVSLMIPDTKNVISTCSCTQKVRNVARSIKPDPSADGNYAIRIAASNGHAEIVRHLLTEPSDSTVDPDLAIDWASENGHAEVVKILLGDSRVDPANGNNRAICLASMEGHAEVVKILLQDSRVNPADENNSAIRLASMEGHAEVVKMLLRDSRVNPREESNDAIRVASENGHAEVVKILLQDSRVDPADGNNRAIRLAAMNGHAEVVKMLLLDSRVNPSEESNDAIRVALASENGHAEVVEILLAESRIDPSDLHKVVYDAIEVRRE
ncbi:ankyrin, partial [Rozella allomycis CSF55]